MPAITWAASQHKGTTHSGAGA